MATNGVSHLTVPDDLNGIKAVLQWLAFTPRFACTSASVDERSMLSNVRDAAPRVVTYRPPAPRRFDVRQGISGAPPPDIGGAGAMNGLFDEGSWIEFQPGWGRTVVTGRARLGGLPVGVVGVETDTVHLSLPADPGLPDSAEQQIPQAGQVCLLLRQIFV
jgi:acetyl-CoA carboxylase/biotin carboxylase 1